MSLFAKTSATDLFARRAVDAHVLALRLDDLKVLEVTIGTPGNTVAGIIAEALARSRVYREGVLPFLLLLPLR